MIFLLDSSMPPFHAATNSVVDHRRAAKLLTGARAELMRADFELVGSHNGVEEWENPSRHPTTVEDVDGEHHVTEWLVDHAKHIDEHGVDGLSKWLKGKPKLMKRATE